MDLKFPCPTCKTPLTVDDTAAGQTFACPACQSSITVPPSQPTRAGSTPPPSSAGRSSAAPPPASKPSASPPPAEPFQRLVNQGIILGEDGQKMSKSRGNAVNPDTVIDEYGADAFRLYEMFMGPLEMMKPWNTKGVEGVYRFLGRVWRLFIDEGSYKDYEQAVAAAPDQAEALLAELKLHEAITDDAPNDEQLKALHACIKKVPDDLGGMRFNTSISALMVFVNDALKWESRPRAALSSFLNLLNPFAPHLAEDLASRLSDVKGGTLAYQSWPVHDESYLVEDTIEFPVQVNGKLRGHITISPDTQREEIERLALECDKIQQFIVEKKVKKVIVVPNRLVNIAVG